MGGRSVGPGHSDVIAAGAPFEQQGTRPVELGVLLAEEELREQRGRGREGEGRGHQQKTRMGTHTFIYLSSCRRKRAVITDQPADRCFLGIWR